MTGPTLIAGNALLWGTFDPSDWQDAVHIESYAALDALMGKRQSLTHPQCSWGKARAADGSLIYRPFPRARLQADRDLGRLSMVTWLSYNLFNQADLSINLHTIVTGDHDAYITAWATAAKAWGHTFILRFDHECNGWWFNGCSEQDSKGNPANGNQLGDYVRAWTHVRAIFRAVGADNATWLWCPNPTGTPGSIQPDAPEHLLSFRPDLADFDLAGTDIYNWGTSKSATAAWRPFAQCANPMLSRLQTIAPGKRIMIGELGCHDQGGDKAAWITDALATMAADPRIVGWCWFNWQLAPTNWLLSSPPAALTAFAAAVASPTYLAAGAFPFGPDLAPLTGYALASTPDTDAQIASLSAQVQAAASEVSAVHGLLDTATTALTAAGVQAQAQQTALDGATALVTAAHAQVGSFQDASRQVTSGLDELRALLPALPT